jgi:hypothetical protein
MISTLSLIRFYLLSQIGLSFDLLLIPNVSQAQKIRHPIERLATSDYGLTNFAFGHQPQTSCRETENET